MESGSTFDRSLDRNSVVPATGKGLSGTANVALNPKEDMQESSSRTSQASVSAALAAASAASRGQDSNVSDSRIPTLSGQGLTGSAIHFGRSNGGRSNGGRSLAEMAQRDLDAALQLLTDRAQYITGSTGAAIALRRSGTNDMLCRATTGSNAPELGTLLSTEFGLSGESVRTRRPLRCDDAERDARVNHAVCREVGIASVVVMPVVHDDEVLGVFELFSGKAHAFGERDLSALQRLSEMVETAVRLARAAEGIPERWTKAAGVFEKDAAGVLEEHDVVIDHSGINDLPLEYPGLEVETEAASGSTTESALAAAATAASANCSPTTPLPTTPAPGSVSAALRAAMPPPAKRPLLWSAANLSSEVAKPAEADQSHVPAVFRNLRQCEACGFPVSSERKLCVECEDKKWRGQLKPRGTAVGSSSGVAAAPALEVRKPDPEQEMRQRLAAVSIPTDRAPAMEQKLESKEGAVQPDAPTQQKVAPEANAAKAVTEPVIKPSVVQPAVSQAPAAQPASPTLVFSAGLEPSQSWLARNKYVLGALLAIAGAVAAILLLR